MLLERRQFHADRIADRISGLYLYTDGSPVTGEELQGMICDIVYKDRTNRRTALPGASLAYGLTSATMNSVALLWAIFLISGPSFEDMSYAIGHTWGITITTDFGTEINCSDVPNILRAFLLWQSGADLLACVPLVDYSSRLFANAIRVIGWGHSWGHHARHLHGVS